MDRKNFVKSFAFLLGVPLVYGSAVHAAKPVELNHKPATALHAFMSNGVNVIETARLIGINNTLHVRIQETYRSYPVYGADGVLHIPHGAKTAKSFVNALTAAQANFGTMNGTFYQGLDADLAKAPAHIFTKVNADLALNKAIDTYLKALGTDTKIRDKHSELMIYIDEANKAHWVYKVSFFAEARDDSSLPGNPYYLMDATTFKVYQQWDEIKTANHHASLDTVTGGGFGGNLKTGKFTYDGLPGNRAAFPITRDADTNTCYMQNDAEKVKRVSGGNLVLSFPCAATDPTHNNIYWSGEYESANGGYSTVNDAMYNGQLVTNFFKDWYNLPVVVRGGIPGGVSLIVHFKMNNAFYSGGVLSMGDGVTVHYHPFTTRDIMAHELSHGFSDQYSKLSNQKEAGSLAESFGDITAKAVEFYIDNTTSWQFGADVLTAKGKAIRYLDQPSKDCEAGGTPGQTCSIENMSQYRDGIDIHYAAGVFNRAFYLLSTTPDWNVKKAYNIFVSANMDYWTSTTTFAKAACGVMSAAKDYGYDTNAVAAAFSQVGIDTSQC